MFMGAVVEKTEEQQIGITDDNKIDIGKSLEELLKNPKKIGTVLADAWKAAFSPANYVTATKSLNEEAFRLARSLGVSSQRTRELTVAVADAIPEFVGIGLEVGDAGKAMSGLYEALGTNLFIGKEALTEFAATAKVTGAEQKTLAVNFRDVGVSVAGIGPKMREVTRIAQQAGVTVKAVSDAVVSNLDKMNLYNFEGGIKGLAKMAAQASRLGISMEGVFGVVDKVFNPEGAINMAAALQRLGVTTSDLLDPLRLMDLSQNDPTELQNQMVNMTKEFVRFNQETKSFEILPGAKRRLNEIGAAMGYNNGELQKMAINAANFDAKLQQIRMPNIPINEETRNLIATMAQMNENGIAEVRVAQVDAQGNLTGEYDPVAVQNLTQQQIERLQKQQLSEGETMSDIAKDQLDELRKLNTRINEFVMAQRYGTASSNLFSGTYVKTLRGFTNDFEQTPFGKEPAGNSETYRKGVNSLSSMSMGDILKKSEDAIKLIMTKIVGTVTSFSTADAIKSVTNMGRSISTTPYSPGDYNNIYSYNTPKSNVEHSGTIKQEIDIKVDFSDVAMLDPEMKRVAGNTFMRLIEETGFQNKFKENQNKTFNKPNEPTNILTEYERGSAT
jgi:hypothetical protein